MGKEKQAEQPLTLEGALLQIAEKDAKIVELESALEGSEGIITELTDKLEATTERMKTGKIVVKNGEDEYQVIGGRVPTLGLEKEIGQKSIPSEELHQYPDLIAELVGKKIGFLVLINKDEI